MAEKKNKVGLLEKIIYGSGDIGLCAMFTLFSSYVLYFYTDVIGMNAAIIGICILVSKIFDGISDIIAGQWIDTHKRKNGHCIPIIMKWTIPMIIAVTLVFLVPNSTIAVRVAFVMVTYNLFNTVFYTLVSAAHSSLASYATDDSSDRAQMLIYKMVFSAAAQTVMASAILPLVNAFGGQNSQTAWIKAILVFGIVGAIFLFLNVAMVKERVQNPAPPENILVGLKAALRNKYWVMAVLMGVCSNLVLIFNLSVSTYYLNKVLGNMALMGAWVAVSNIPGIFIGMIVPFFLGKGIKQRQLIIIGAVVMLCAQIAFVFSPTGNVTALLVTGLIKGIGFGFPMGMINSLIAETIDYGEWKTGVRTPSVLMSGGSVAGKIGQGALTSLFGVFLTVVGYDGLREVQSAGTIAGIDAFFKFGPLAVIIVIIVLAWFFRVEDTKEQVQKELVARRGEL